MATHAKEKDHAQKYLDRLIALGMSRGQAKQKVRERVPGVSDAELDEPRKVEPNGDIRL